MEKEIFTINDPIDEAGHRFMEVRNTGIPKFKKLDNWLKKEANIFWNENKKKKKYPTFKQGAIIKVDFGINIGSEMCHTHFAIVMNEYDNEKKETITVIPISSKNKKIMLT